MPLPERYIRRLEHPDDVKAWVSQGPDGYRLTVDFGSSLPEMNHLYRDPKTALQAVEDLQAIGFLVRGAEVLEIQSSDE